MERRLYSKCGLYLASVKEVSLHEQMHKRQKTTPSDIPYEPPSKQSTETVQTPRLRPQRVAARRQKELRVRSSSRNLSGWNLMMLTLRALSYPQFHL